MGWFNEQMKSRVRTDVANFENSMMDLSSVVLGKSAIAANINNDRVKAQSAVEEILKHYKAKIIEVPKEIEDMNEQLEYVLRPTGIMKRVVHLTGDWWKDAIGPMLGQTKSGDIVALMPCGLSGYQFLDYETDSIIKLNNKNKDLIRKEAMCFYTPFPLKKLKIRDLAMYIISTLNKADIIMILLSYLAVTLLGMISPMVQKLVYGKVVPSGEVRFILPVASLLIGMTLSQTLISIARSLIMSRVQTKMNMSITCASMGRVVSLPASFFKSFSSGELATRVGAINSLCSQLANVFLTTGLSAVFSFTYVFQMVGFAPALVIPSLVIVVAHLIVTILGVFLQLNISRRSMKIGAKLSGFIFSLFSGVQKIKLAGAERRAFSKWAEHYKKQADLQYDPPFILKIMPVVGTIVSLVGTLINYYFAITSKVAFDNYIAFNASFGQVSGAIMALAGIATTFATIKPTVEMVEPILNEEPEVSDNKKIVTNISGNIEISHVSFRYKEDAPLVLDDVSLKIAPGQYVAIVGRTGCGKSTLLRLLLGFEKPSVGSVYYDSQDISKLDLRSLRQKIGVVMQDGKLFAGDVYSNIVISAPWLTKEAAWEAADLAGVAEDIRNMPMEMNTLISEGAGGISGGQRQRLMIARAIAPKPKILMLDEATSALDNITQKQVSDSLAGLESTRIVIAHRLSTIKHCDRIIMLDKGRIIEDGKYDELIEKGGHFAELVKRQQIESTEEKK
ncbi:MAG: NHLP bacteriocin export ABC transporter permease/ATPase subunit [Oscillospiraceae bacterium]|nr:NHLP bacteriocin export ABC transporter permease/ATPase subunit [Oscillospiraceae bacterium]